MKKSAHNPINKAFLSWLQSHRESQELSVRDAGPLVGETHQIVSKIETGVRRIDVFEYVQYCRGLDIDPYEGIALLESLLDDDTDTDE